MGDENGKKKTTVTINGQSYRISGNADVNYIIKVANYVDEKMKQLRKVNPNLDRTQLAVLAAINICDEYLQLKMQIDRDKKDGDN